MISKPTAAVMLVVPSACFFAVRSPFGTAAAVVLGLLALSVPILPDRWFRRIGEDVPADPYAGCPDDETISAFADDVLGEPARARVTAHLLGCPACRDVVAVTRAFGATRAAH